MPIAPTNRATTDRPTASKTSAMPARSNLTLALLVALLGLPIGQGAQAATIDSGQPISEGLQQHAAASGWKLHWELGEDYYLEQALDVPGKNILADIRYALTTYRAMGGFEDVGAIESGKKTIVVRRTEAARGQSEFDPAAARLSTMRMNALNHPGLAMAASAGPEAIDTRTAALENVSVPAAAPSTAGSLMPLGTNPMPAAKPVSSAAPTFTRPSARREVTEPQPLALEQPSAALALAPMPAPLAPTTPTPVPTSQLQAAEPAMRQHAMPAPAPKPQVVATAAPTPSIDTAPAVVKAPTVAQAPVNSPRVTTPAVPAKTWTAANGSTLQSTIKAWAKEAGWVVAWNDERPDLEVVGTVNVPGSLVDAVSYLFNVYQRSGADYDVELYTEQKLVLVKKQ